jgi:hypothetical protein
VKVADEEIEKRTDRKIRFPKCIAVTGHVI